MKADTNNLNVKIYRELLKLAISYFVEVSGKWAVNSYDAKEANKALSFYSKESGLHVAERTVKSWGFKAELNKDPLIKSVTEDREGYGCRTTIEAYRSGKQFSVSVDSFNCSFDACKVFDYLAKFEKLAGIPAKEKAMFVKKASQKEAINHAKLISFDIDIDKNVLPICKHVDTSGLSPVMNNILIDVNSGVLVASDGHILSEYPANIYNIVGEINKNCVFISPDALKKCIGTCHVDVYEIAEDKYTTKHLTVVTNNQGAEFRNMQQGMFPNYKNVLPLLSKDGFIQIVPGELKGVVSFLKTCKKVKGIKNVCFTVVQGQSFITLKYTDEFYTAQSKVELKVNLESPARCSMNINFSYDVILQMGKWTGGIWFVGSGIATIFDDADALLNLIMPYQISEDLITYVKSGKSVPAEERYCNRDSECCKQSVTTIQTPATEIETTIPDVVVETSTKAGATFPDAVVETSSKTGPTFPDAVVETTDKVGEAFPDAVVNITGTVKVAKIEVITQYTAISKADRTYLSGNIHAALISTLCNAFHGKAGPIISKQHRPPIARPRGYTPASLHSAMCATQMFNTLLPVTHGRVISRSCFRTRKQTGPPGRVLHTSKELILGGCSP